MMMWIVTTVLASAVAVLLSAPFIWRYAVQHSTAAFAAVAPPPDLSSFKRTWAAAATGLAALAFIGIYTLTGDRLPSADPSAADRSILSLASQPAGAVGNRQLFLTGASSEDQLLQQLKQFAGGGTFGRETPKSNIKVLPVDELIGRLVARLEKNPKDIEGWRTLGWSYVNLQRFDEAGAAYAKAIELNPNIADFYSARGEALVKAANGTVVPEAESAFNAALKLNAKEPRARYFIGLAKAQAGNKTAALDDWIDLANDAGTNDPAIPSLAQRLADLATELGVDPTQRLRRPIDAARGQARSPSNSGIVGSVPHSTTQSELKAGDANAPAANQAPMIGEMVARLENRLERSPRDVDGWIMLIRSQTVLNDREAARQAYERAMRVFGAQTPEHDRLTAAAKEFGLSP